MRAIEYAFAEALQGFMRRKLVAFLSTVTIAVSLGVFGLLLALGRAGDDLVSNLAEKAQIVVYLKADLPALVLDDLLRTVRADERVASAEFRSSEEALQRFRALFPDLAAVPEEIGSNPFPPSIEVALRTGGAAFGAETLTAAWLKNPAVEDVQYDAALVARVSAFVRLLRAGALILGVILATASVFTITNVIRLSIYAREDEIEIMRLVGAPAAYIRGPFLAEGLLEGLLGGAVACLIAAAGLSSMGSALRDANFAATLLPGLGTGGIAALLGLGGVVGLSGSYLSLGRLRD